MRWIIWLCAGCAGFVLGSVEAYGGFAAQVISYTPGAISPAFQNPAAALGMPVGDTSFGVLTPFNPPFLGSDIVGIGQGGSLVLRLGATARTRQGATLGVHAAAGLIDHDWPNGFAGPVATLFTTPRSAEVLVSEDGSQWFSLGLREFDLPTNFYSEGVTTPGFQMEPGTRIADFSKPFTGTLADFNGLSWPQILGILDRSAGGFWVDLTNVPYSGVNFIRFDVTTQDQVMYVDAVAVAVQPMPLGELPFHKRFPPIATVPEPASLAGIVVLLMAFVRRR